MSCVSDRVDVAAAGLPGDTGGDGEDEGRNREEEGCHDGGPDQAAGRNAQAGGL